MRAALRNALIYITQPGYVLFVVLVCFIVTIFTQNTLHEFLELAGGSIVIGFAWSLLWSVHNALKK